MENVNNFLELLLFKIGDHELRIVNILTVVLVIIITKSALWIIKAALFRKKRSRSIDRRNAYSLYQIIRYILWVISISIILNALGISVTVLLAGSAALLVGIGLGLQQTFNDFISGLILLIEGTTKIGDILEIDGDIVMIQKIGLRTSKGMNRDEVDIIIPNSLITTNKVINWSHQSMKTRFRINVGVAYGSDVELVSRILKESTIDHPDITDRDSIEVRLIDFGNSSLDFQVLFFSNNVFRIEKVKSDIRKTINKRFIENSVVIPFPQLDLHVKENSRNS